MSTSILIAGYGKLGSDLAASLPAQEWQRHIVCRRPREDADLHFHYADLTAGPLPALPAVDFVVVMLAPGSRDEAHYRALYVAGTQRLVEALPVAPRRLFFISSTSVYGQYQHEWVDENSITAPEGYSGQVLLEAEALVHAYPFPTTVLRLSGIYGEGRNHLLSQVQAGQLPAPEPVLYTNRIHQRDAVGAIVHLLTLARANTELAPCYLVTDNHPVPLYDVCQWLAARLGVQETSTGNFSRRSGSKQCSNILLTKTGYNLRYPSYKDGYQAFLEDF